jgi:hypothetical protein
MRYHAANTQGFSMPDDFVEVKLRSKQNAESEEDRLMFEDEEVALYSSRMREEEPPQSRRRRFCAAVVLLVIFFIVVILAVSQDHANTSDDSVSTLPPTTESDQQKGPGKDKSTNEETSAHDKDVYGDGNENGEETSQIPEGGNDDGSVDGGAQGDPEEEDEEHEAIKNVAKESPMRTLAPTPAEEILSEDNESDDISHTVWGLNLQRTLPHPNTKPGLVFIKGMKVGGTSVALALNQAAVTYKIRLAPVSFDHNKLRNEQLPSCAITRGGTLYFRHGYQNAWEKQW